MSTGKAFEFNNNNIDFEDLPHAALASSSIPFVFAPHQWEGVGLFMDGGTVVNENVDSAIHRCRDLVDDDSKIIIDILICRAPGVIRTIEQTGDTIDNYMRAWNIHNFHSGTHNILLAKAHHPHTNFRYIINQK